MSLADDAGVGTPAAAGAAIGSVIPGVGTVIGGTIGLIGGAISDLLGSIDFSGPGSARTSLRAQMGPYLASGVRAVPPASYDAALGDARTFLQRVIVPGFDVVAHFDDDPSFVDDVMSDVVAQAPRPFVPPALPPAPPPITRARGNYGAILAINAQRAAAAKAATAASSLRTGTLNAPLAHPAVAAAAAIRAAADAGPRPMPPPAYADGLSSPKPSNDMPLAFWLMGAAVVLFIANSKG